MTDDDRPDVTGLRGAVYVPARAFHAYQTWRDYDEADVERDLGYAASLNLTGLRMFLSYEFWLEDAAAHARRFDHLLGAAAERGLGIVPILFESAGREPTRENLTDRDPLTAAAVRSPSHAVVKNQPRGPTSDGVPDVVRTLIGRDHRWDEPAAFVEWVMQEYGDDDRLVAIELMNEPGGWPQREAFARAMLRTADDHRGSVPLTMGSKSLENNRLYENPPLDVHQFHYNNPPTPADMEATLAEARDLREGPGAPVWLSEWQRTREEPPDVLLPNYASLAATIRDGGIDGDFFWSLMVTPAYLPDQRTRGRLNGVFHEDGAVWSAADARAIADDPDLDVQERLAWPAWATLIAEHADAPGPRSTGG